MPGFNVVNAGGGGGPSNTIEVRRAHRWVFETLGPVAPNVLLLLQSAQRPSFSFDEPEMHHNQEKVYFAGKQSWEPISLVWYDGEQSPDVSEAVYNWLNTVVDIPSANVAPVNTYKAEASLQVQDGQGASNERWEMYGVWPQAVNYQELNYTSTDLMTVEATMRYDRARRF